jgi:hypothetical protein
LSATKLADIKALQNLMISNEEKLLELSKGEEKGEQRVAESLTNMLQDDRQSLIEINEAISKLGMSSQPNDTVKHMVETIEGIMSENHLDVYEKFMQQEGLKHQLVMTGLLVHQAAQATDGILQKLIYSINES